MLIPLLVEDSRALPAPPASFRSAPRYSDGSYSDIPAEAFLMDSLQAPPKHTSKKDLAQFRAVASPSPSPPGAVVAECVRYFQGRSAASSEALLQLCAEVLDDAHVEDLVHAHGEGGAGPCAQGGGGLGALVHTLLQLFPGGDGRRRWLIMNTNHPDPL